MLKDIAAGQRAMTIRMLIEGHADPVSAKRLGVSPRTYAGYVADLKGEYALGAWWAVRVGGVLAVAAVVFHGIWLNLRSTIPPIVRVLEVALVGAGLFWGGLRLSLKRKDLGEVLAASGLAVWQFAAWATYGLDKMRVCDSAAAAIAARAPRRLSRSLPMCPTPARSCPATATKASSTARTAPTICTGVSEAISSRMARRSNSASRAEAA